MMKIKTLSERKKEIELLMQYAVPRSRFKEAMKFVHEYEGDGIALNLLHHFYSNLPEAVDDGIYKLRLLARRQGAFLLCATSFIADYLYIATSINALYVGRMTEGIVDEEMLEFFEFESRQAFLDLTNDPSQLEEYVPVDRNEEICPICRVATGEYHTLGCPVEICPWCSGQLTHCNCRFVELGVEQLTEEADIERLQERLEEVGRISFAAEQRPGYPTLGDEGEDDREEPLI
jgi:hypothetical protein